MQRALLFVKRNIAELYLLVIFVAMTIGSTPNYLALILTVIVVLLLYLQQKTFGIVFGSLIGLMGIYLCFALLSDLVKIKDFATKSALQFMIIGSMLCLSLLLASIWMIKKYFYK